MAIRVIVGCSVCPLNAHSCNSPDGTHLCSGDPADGLARIIFFPRVSTLVTPTQIFNRKCSRVPMVMCVPG